MPPLVVILTALFRDAPTQTFSTSTVGFLRFVTVHSTFGEVAVMPTSLSGRSCLYGYSFANTDGQTGNGAIH